MNVEKVFHIHFRGCFGVLRRAVGEGGEFLILNVEVAFVRTLPELERDSI